MDMPFRATKSLERRASETLDARAESWRSHEIGGAYPIGIALRAPIDTRDRNACRRQPEWRHFWRMAALSDGSRRTEPGGAGRAGPLRRRAGRRHGVPRAGLCRRRGQLLWRAGENRAHIDDGAYRGVAASSRLGRGAQGDRSDLHLCRARREPPTSRAPSPRRLIGALSNPATRCVRADCYPWTALGSISAGSLFMTFPTRLSTGQRIISSAG